jgi:hypothetical protein
MEGTLQYNQEGLEFLHQNTLERIVDEEENPEEFLNEQVWPIVVDFMSDLGVELHEEYRIKLSDKIFDDQAEKSDFAGSAGQLVDSINDEKAIRLNPGTNLSLLPLIAHEADHKYQNELKEPARQIGNNHSVFKSLGGWSHYMDYGNGVDFQYSALAHQRPERLDKIGELGDKEVNKWDRKARNRKEELAQEYRERFDVDIDLEDLLGGNLEIRESGLEAISEEYGVEKAKEIQNWYNENSNAYRHCVKNKKKTSRLVSKAVEREMELADIDQKNYQNPNYDEAFTMAVTLFAFGGLEEDVWRDYIESDSQYAEEPMTTIISEIYDRAIEAEGDKMEKMRKGLELQDQNYIEGDFLS